MELSSSSTTQSGHHLRIRTVQTTAEGTPFSGSMNTMALCDFDMRRLRRTLTYLLTYLLTLATPVKSAYLTSGFSYASQDNMPSLTTSVCGPDEYFDGMDNSCVHCSVICNPNVKWLDFCHNNCPGIYSIRRELTKCTVSQKRSLTWTCYLQSARRTPFTCRASLLHRLDRK